MEMSLQRVTMQTKALLLALAFLVAACGSSDSPSASTAPPTTVASSTSAPPTTPATTSAPPSTTSTTTTSAPTTTIAEVAPVVTVPRAEPPTIDGVIAPEEWTEAAAFGMSDGATVYFLHNDETLYVGVAGHTRRAVNVVIASADSVSILHSSAALGSALYARSGSAWELVHGFTWCCRRLADESEREALFADEAWYANIGDTGDPGVVEYAIAIPWQDVSLAISSVRSETYRGFWPAGLSREAQDQLVGVPPQDREYNIEEWGTLSAG